MATRLYVANASPDYRPSVRGGWDLAGSTLVGALSTVKTGAVASETQTIGSTTDNWDVLVGRWVSDTLAIDTAVSGTLRWILAVEESATSTNAYFHVHVFVVDPSSDAVRGTVLANAIGDTEWPTTAAGCTEPAQTLSGVNAVAGDRVVAEVGYQGSAARDVRTGTVYYGGTGPTDLALGDTTTSYPGFVEFSQNLTFGTPVSPVSGPPGAFFAFL